MSKSKAPAYSTQVEQHRKLCAQSIASAGLQPAVAESLIALHEQWLTYNAAPTARQGWGYLLAVLSCVVDFDGAVVWRRPERSMHLAFECDSGPKARRPVALAWRMGDQVLLGIGHEGAAAQEPTSFAPIRKWSLASAKQWAAVVERNSERVVVLPVAAVEGLLQGRATGVAPLDAAGVRVGVAEVVIAGLSRDMATVIAGMLGSSQAFGRPAVVAHDGGEAEDWLLRYEAAQYAGQGAGLCWVPTLVRSGTTSADVTITGFADAVADAVTIRVSGRPRAADGTSGQISVPTRVAVWEEPKTSGVWLSAEGGDLTPLRVDVQIAHSLALSLRPEAWRHMGGRGGHGTVPASDRISKLNGDKDFPSAEAGLALAGCQRLPRSLVANLTQHPSPRVRQAVAHHHRSKGQRGTTYRHESRPAAYQTLLDAPEPEVRAALLHAQTPLTAAEQCQIWADVTVAILLANPRIVAVDPLGGPIPILERLLGRVKVADHVAIADRFAAAAASHPNLLWHDDTPNQLRRALAAAPSLPVRLLDALTVDPDEETRAVAAGSSQAWGPLVNVAQRLYRRLAEVAAGDISSARLSAEDVALVLTAAPTPRLAPRIVQLPEATVGALAHIARCGLCPDPLPVLRHQNAVSWVWFESLGVIHAVPGDNSCQPMPAIDRELLARWGGRVDSELCAKLDYEARFALDRHRSAAQKELLQKLCADPDMPPIVAAYFGLGQRVPEQQSAPELLQTAIAICRRTVTLLPQGQDPADPNAWRQLAESVLSSSNLPGGAARCLANDADYAIRERAIPRWVELGGARDLALFGVGPDLMPAVAPAKAPSGGDISVFMRDFDQSPEILGAILCCPWVDGGAWSDYFGFNVYDIERLCSVLARGCSSISVLDWVNDYHDTSEFADYQRRRAELAAATK